MALRPLFRALWIRLDVQGGRGEDSYQQFDIEIGDLPFEASFDDADHHLLIGYACSSFFSV